MRRSLFLVLLCTGCLATSPSYSGSTKSSFLERYTIITNPNLTYLEKQARLNALDSEDAKYEELQEMHRALMNKLDDVQFQLEQQRLNHQLEEILNEIY